MKKIFIAALAAFFMAGTALAQTPPFWQTYWYGFTGGNCGGSMIVIFEFSTLESLWNQGTIRSYRKVTYGSQGHCSMETPDEEENTN